MSSWIIQHFLNPAFFWPGMALVSLPIIIHLLNRLRYKRVRFAAMEFLLASQKRNRRRILFEQLLLLLLRIALVLLIVGLIGRFILDPEQLSLFQGARSHHVLILDDTASMRDRQGEQSVFENAKDVIRKMVAEGARHPGTQLLTLIRVSNPDETVSGLSERVVDESVLTEVTERLSVMNCTHQSADPAAALEAASKRLAANPAAVRHVHLISDFRESDWLDNKAAVSMLQQLAQQETKLNLIRCVAETHENVSLVALGGAVEVAAAGVPVTLEATVRNQGTREIENLRASVFIDGERLPRTIDFQTVGADQSATRSFDVVFDSPQQHEVRLEIAEDALDVDNQRFLAVDVPLDNPVLLIDGSPATEQALYVADALAADKSVTGFAPDIRTPEELRRIPLDNYHLIYLINVPELAPDALVELEKYVAGGGGLIWYLGDAVRPAFYNDSLFGEETALFPVRLGIAPDQLERAGEVGDLPDIQPVDSPLFKLFQDAEVPILDLVIVNLFYPVEMSDDHSTRAKDVKLLATLQDKSPLMFEHPYGSGKVFTCLTAAGPLMNPEGVLWTNWANGPASFSFAVFQLELAKRFVRKDRALPQLEAGSPLVANVNQAFYLPDVELITPNDQATRLQASPGESAAEGEADASNLLETVFRDTDEPGIYQVLLSTRDQEQEKRLYAFNVSPQEGDLAVVTDQTLLRNLGEGVDVAIQAAGSYEWIRSESPGSEVRWAMLVLLALICITEQALASRLSYQR